MGNLDKDIHEKESAIRFCILNDYLPFLEVIVKNQRELSETETIITDIDVLGISVDNNGLRKRIVFDCKTLGKTSPINRAFWANGLMQYTSCNEGFIILKKKASEAHRLSAKSISVHLFDDKQFQNYAESYSLDFNSDYCYATDIDNWIKHANIYSKNINFNVFGMFLNNEIPLELDAARGIRRLIAALNKGKGEFNPDKPEHLSVFQHVVMVFSYLMSQIVQDLKNVIDFDANQDDFERLLKNYIWGGREAFKQRERMLKAFKTYNQSLLLEEPELKEWNLFVELVRKLLDSPKDVFKCCFPMREISFRNLIPHEDIKETYLAKYIAENKRIRQFLTSSSKYLVKSAQLPSEFDSELSTVFDMLMEKV